MSSCSKILTMLYFLIMNRMIACVLVTLIYKCHIGKKIFSEVKSRQNYTNGKCLVDSHFSTGVLSFVLNFNEFSFASISTIHLYDQTSTHHLLSKVFHFQVPKLKYSFSDCIIPSPFSFFCCIH